MVTRHLYNMVPLSRGGLRPVSALAPGVLGLTGIETGEIVQGSEKAKQPVAIDALAVATGRLADLFNFQLRNQTGIRRWQPPFGIKA